MVDKENAENKNMLIGWTRFAPGCYESDDSRFLINKVCNATYGKYWQLTDQERRDKFGRDVVYACDSLHHAKLIAMRASAS